METSRILFNCKVAVTNKRDLVIVDRILSPEFDEHKGYPYDDFDETNTKDYSIGLEINPVSGYYFCQIWLVYETNEICGGQWGTEHNSYLEFGELKLITT